ncbi:MAG TPA: DUF523 and DUF1722 domain-containing protein [Myxococcaceae bacterium]|nr:DUF523 and DUF1722 domain-containing protein [Myxococcaceae bacterium]
MATPVTARRLRIGVSACLLGHEVRWDGQHKRDAWLVEVLGPRVEWVPVCPEVEIGLGVPREPIRLVGDPRAPRLVSESGVDLTQRMRTWAQRRTRELEALDLCGYVLKEGSPSCGMERVRVHPARGGRTRRQGTGAFARVLTKQLPLLPIEEERRLCDAQVREAFLERIFAYARWKEALAAGMAPSSLARFHARHELMLLAHGPAAPRRLGALVAAARPSAFERTVRAYGRGFMDALRQPATRSRHARALGEVLKRLGTVVSSGDRAELGSAVRAYEQGLAPLEVPLALARQWALRLGVESLADQVYLNVERDELALRHPA